MELKTSTGGAGAANSAPPEGMHTITPHLVGAGAAQAIEFYREAFNAVEISRLPGPDGKLMHATVRFQDSVVMLVDEMPEWGSLGPKSLKGSPVTIHPLRQGCGRGNETGRASWRQDHNAARGRFLG